ncbi:MAG: hypothetical protein KF858_04130, partial [Candidatus Sumerlaeia bacterium]|nr:hypothetical protein [Candidatus Sumerlaeia bacterium]
SFVLANPGDAAIGSGSELAITAATNTSVNKFSIHDYTGGTTGGLSFSVRFLAADTGTWQIFVGDGASFSDNNGFTSAQVAAGLQFAMQSSTTDITTSIRNGGSWTAGTSVDGEFVTGVTYRVDMFVNKSGSSANYTYTDTNLYSLANGAMDVWIDGTRHAGLATGALAASFDSFMVIGISSTSNESVIILDDIAYHNSFTSTLPVELDLFQID